MARSVITSVRTLSLLLLSMLPIFTASAEEERSFKIINAANGLADNSAQVVKCTKTGRLIISTIGNLNFYDGKSFSHADASADYEALLPFYHGHYHLYFDRAHHIWLKDKGKVTCLDLYVERFIANVDSVIRSMGCTEPVLDLFGDQYNQMWFLTGKGLYSPRFNRMFPVQRERNLQDVDMAGSTMYAFYDNGEVVGCDTLGNVVCQVKAYDWDTGKDYISSSVLQPYGKGFYQIRNGQVGAILLFFDVTTNTFTEVARTPYHLNNMVLNNRGNRIYIPSEYGYYVYPPDTGELEHIEQLELTNGTKMITDCNTMAFDHQGGMWIGTEKRGLLYARPHSLTIKAYPWSNPLALEYDRMMEPIEQNITEYEGKRANCKYVDSRGWTWVGTRVGLYLERPGQTDAELFNKLDGLNNEVIHSIIEDKDHHIWVATSSGISFLLIRNNRVEFINNFGTDDNVPDESFENCKAIRLADGTIVMKAIEHVVAFNPVDLREVNEPHLLTNIKPKLIKLLVNGNTIEPAIPLEGNIIVEKALSRTRDINLKSDQNSISLVFSALNYFRPLQTYYRVRVPEIDKEWKTYSHHTTELVDNTGMLHYPLPNLKPGNYHIEVQASMFPNIWEEDIDDKDRFIWEIHVKEPWWRTSGLFVIVGVVLLTLLIINFLLYNRNTRMRDQRNREEGDIIRKIQYFVDRCEAYSQQTMGLGQDEQLVDINSRQTPEFIELMLKLVPFVSAKQTHKLTMRSLSEAANVDIVTLYEVVTGNLYKSPRELARLIKLRRAVDLLTQSDHTIEHIANECGFSTPNFFLGNFFHEYKLTPAEYRKQKKKKA